MHTSHIKAKKSTLKEQTEQEIKDAAVGAVAPEERAYMAICHDDDAPRNELSDAVYSTRSMTPGEAEWKELMGEPVLNRSATHSLGKNLIPLSQRAQWEVLLKHKEAVERAKSKYGASQVELRPDGSIVIHGRPIRKQRRRL